MKPYHQTLVQIGNKLYSLALEYEIKSPADLKEILNTNKILLLNDEIKTHLNEGIYGHSILSTECKAEILKRHDKEVSQ